MAGDLVNVDRMDYRINRLGASLFFDPITLKVGADRGIDDMVVHAKFMAGKTGTYAGNQRPGYDGWTSALGDGQANRVWIYDACDAGGCHDKPGDLGHHRAGGLLRSPNSS